MDTEVQAQALTPVQRKEKLLSDNAKTVTFNELDCERYVTATSSVSLQNERADLTLRLLRIDLELAKRALGQPQMEIKTQS